MTPGILSVQNLLVSLYFPHGQSIKDISRQMLFSDEAQWIDFPVQMQVYLLLKYGNLLLNIWIHFKKNTSAIR